MKISARNQIPAKVVGVTEGPATAVVELGISAGTDVTAIVKASDVMLGVAD